MYISDLLRPNRSTPVTRGHNANHRRIRLATSFPLENKVIRFKNYIDCKSNSAP